jgi:GntR family transcriptional regulator, rspAB operon transcriptional repressor
VSRRVAHALARVPTVDARVRAVGPGPAIAGRLSESARIHAALRAAILDVALVPGAVIAEHDLAARFGVSRTPVREALLRLADEGLVDVKPQRGTFVARLSLKRIEEALFVRQAVECMILERVAAREDRVAIAARLAAIVVEQAAAIDAGDVGTALDADTRFHHAMVVASGLEGVWRVVGEARDLHHRIRAIAVPELGSAAQAIRDHRAIVRAVCEGEASRAARAMAKHLERNFALAKAIAALHPDYFDGTTRA